MPACRPVGLFERDGWFNILSGVSVEPDFATNRPRTSRNLQHRERPAKWDYIWVFHICQYAYLPHVWTWATPQAVIIIVFDWLIKKAITVGFRIAEVGRETMLRAIFAITQLVERKSVRGTRFYELFYVSATKSVTAARASRIREHGLSRSQRSRSGLFRLWASFGVSTSRNINAICFNQSACIIQSYWHIFTLR